MQRATTTHSVRLGLWVNIRTVSDQITPYPGFLPPRKEIGAAQDDGAGRRTDQIQYEET
jgi:hypothetical protein